MSSGPTRLAAMAMLAAFVSLMPVGEAEAGASPCIMGSGGNGTAALDLVNDGCVAFKGDPFGVYGPPGGDSEEAVEQAILAATNAAVDISLFGKSEDGADTSLIDITPIKTDGEGGILTGEWRVLDDAFFVKYITIKASTGYVLYELDGLGAQSGTFTTAALVNNKGKPRALSHISFWLSRTAVEVPEPASIGLLGGGLLALGAMCRRKRAGNGRA